MKNSQVIIVRKVRTVMVVDTCILPATKPVIPKRAKVRPPRPRQPHTGIPDGLTPLRIRVGVTPPIQPVATHVYAPMSPSREESTYEPSSPRTGNSVIGKIMRSIHDNKGGTFRKAPFEPYDNHIFRIKAMKSSGEFTDTFIEAITQKHIDYYERYPTPEPKPRNALDSIPQCVDDTVTRTRVLADGTIRTKTDAPLAIIGRRNIYTCNVDEYLIAMKKFGYPEWVLKQTLEKYQKYMREKDDYIAWFNRVFSKYKSTKPAKPKKKHIRERAKKFIPKYLQLDENDK